MTGNEVAGPHIEAPIGEARVLTFTLGDGREIKFDLLGHGEVLVSERRRADFSLAWSAPISPTHDSATPRGVTA